MMFPAPADSVNQFRPTSAHIHLEALEHNLRVLTAPLPKDAFICPMVKADAYGHGDVAVARYLEKKGHRRLGVSLIEEGLRLRSGGVSCEILVFGLFDRGAEAIIESRLTPVLSTFVQWESLAAEARRRNTTLPVHLKVETGMGRLGFSAREWENLADRLADKSLRPMGLLSHLHSGEDADQDEGSTQKQIRNLRAARERLGLKGVAMHLWNTAALIALHQKESALAEFGARPGLGMYGLSTGTHDLPLKPAMSLRSRVMKINRLSAGETVSYGATWKARQESLVGVVPIGYGDGYHRILSNVGVVLVEGERVPVIGRVCMDYLMVDLTALKGRDLLNKEVVFFGQDSEGRILSAAEVADKAQTAPWEVLTSISARVPRHFTEEGRAAEGWGA